MVRWGGARRRSSLVWYGVPARCWFGRWAGGDVVQKREALNGVTVTVQYPNKRSAIADLQEGCWAYGGSLRETEKGNASFIVDGGRIYTDLVNEIAKFLRTGVSPVPFEETLEVMAL